MTTEEALAVAGLVIVAGAAAWAVKRALIGDRPVRASFRCWARGRHDAARHPLGGFRCIDCGVAGADLLEMGFDDGYVQRIQREGW